MIVIKINIKVVIVSIFIAVLMYPKTIGFLINSGKNIYIATKLSTINIQDDNTKVNTDKTKIIFMFDDGWKSVYSEAYNVIDEYNYKGNVALIPSLIGEEEYMTYEQLSELYLQGWDLINQSYSHEEDMYNDSDKLLSDFNKARQWMENRYIGKCSDMIVIPYGEINPYLIDRLRDAEYHNVRISDNIIKLKNNNIEYYPISMLNLLTDITVDEAKKLLIQKSKKHNTIMIILNKIRDTDKGYGMTYSKDKFEQIVMFINENKDEFEVVTYSQLF